MEMAGLVWTGTYNTMRSNVSSFLRSDVDLRIHDGSFSIRSFRYVFWRAGTNSTQDEAAG